MIDREDSTDIEAADDAEVEATEQQLPQVAQTVPEGKNGQQKPAGHLAENRPEPPQS
jgi:hypothetical protein